LAGRNFHVHPRGVLALDNVSIDHTGKLIDDVGTFWDHSEQRYKIAHDYLFINYVNQYGQHYPLEFYRFKKRDQCEIDQEQFVNHTQLFIDLVNWSHAKKLWGTFTFESYFSNGEILNHINSLRDDRNEIRGYVVRLKSNRIVTFHGQSQQASALVASILPDDKKSFVNPHGKKQWYFTVTVKVSEVDHHCRIVLLWDKKFDKEAKLILITNKTNWEINRIMRRIVLIGRERKHFTETANRNLAWAIVSCVTESVR
jgi:hypothetical protein